MKRYNVQGSWPAIVTPFDDEGDVNLEALRRLLDFHVEFGSNGVLLLGSTGEPILLTRDERRRIVEASVDHVNGRMPIMCGVSAPSTRETIENARHARDAAIGLPAENRYLEGLALKGKGMRKEAQASFAAALEIQPGHRRGRWEISGFAGEERGGNV